MAKFKIPKLAKAGKVGHGKTKAHKGQDLLALASKLTAHRKGSAGTAKLRTHTGKGLRAEFGLPARHKGSVR
jgi:hypothetical protein